MAAFLQSAQGKSKAKTTTPEHELAQKESEYNTASANERLLEKRLQKSTETVEKLRKQLQDEQDILGRLVPALSQAKETTKQSPDGLRAMRIAVHGANGAGYRHVQHWELPTGVARERRATLTRGSCVCRMQYEIGNWRCRKSLSRRRSLTKNVKLEVLEKHLADMGSPRQQDEGCVKR